LKQAIICINLNKYLKYFRQKVASRLVTPNGSECKRPLHMLGRHICPWQQANNAECTHA